MTQTDILRILADANRKIGDIKGQKYYSDYADILENKAVVLEAEEIKKENL